MKDALIDRGPPRETVGAFRKEVTPGSEEGEGTKEHTSIESSLRKTREVHRRE